MWGATWTSSPGTATSRAGTSRAGACSTRSPGARHLLSEFLQFIAADQPIAIGVKLKHVVDEPGRIRARTARALRTTFCLARGRRGAWTRTKTALPFRGWTISSFWPPARTVCARSAKLRTTRSALAGPACTGASRSGTGPAVTNPSLPIAAGSSPLTFAWWWRWSGTIALTHFRGRWRRGRHKLFMRQLAIAIAIKFFQSLGRVGNLFSRKLVIAIGIKDIQDRKSVV